MTHAFTVDVEDWYRSAISTEGEVSERFEPNVMKVLEALGGRGVHATFFVLGIAAKSCPRVVKAIAEAGHEVQSHGYAHQSNFVLDAEGLRQDLLRAKGLLEDITGREVYGYRSPYWTIDGRNLWALDVLAETGHRYDSSIWPKLRKSITPVGADTYGMADYPLAPALVTTPAGRLIVEAPPACVRWMGRLWAIAGGGHFRLWPYPLIRRLWLEIERQGRSGVLYMHPYEYDYREMADRKEHLSLKFRLHQGLGRKGFPRKIDRLLRRFRFAPMSQVLSGLLSQVR